MFRLSEKTLEKTGFECFLGNLSMFLGFESERCSLVKSSDDMLDRNLLVGQSVAAHRQPAGLPEVKKPTKRGTPPPLQHPKSARKQFTQL